MISRRFTVGFLAAVIVVTTLVAAGQKLEAAHGLPFGDAGLNGDPVDLTARAKAEGSVRVIVELDVPVRSEGSLSTSRDVGAQRERIAAAQSALLAELAGRKFGVLARYKTIRFLALELSPDALAALQQSRLVRDIQEDRANFPTLADSIPIVQADQAWAAGFDGSGQAVAILDTGVDGSHPFLAGKVVSEACFTTQIFIFPGNCPDGSTTQLGPGAGVPCPQPGCDHGTHVAGIATGKGVHSGVAKEANIVAIQIFSAIGSTTLAFDSDIIKGLERVLALSGSMDIASVNMSLGGGLFTSQPQCDLANAATKAAIDNLRSVGIATVIASGNESAKNAISSPGCISSAVSVGATDKFDVVASFSNSAPFLDLLAPGVNIISSVPGGGFASKSGTSMATPHVAGAWAILKQADPGASVDSILNALKSTGVPITDVNSLTKPRIQIFDALAGPGGTPSPRGRVYQATVDPSFGGPFQDCLRFFEDGTFAMDGLGPGGWTELFLGPQASVWRTLAGDPGVPLFVLLVGLTSPATGDNLAAFGFNNQGDTFRVTGSENPACSLAAPAQGSGNPYQAGP